MIDAHLLKLRRRHEISAEEERAIRGIIAEVRTYPRHRAVIRAGEELNQSLLLVSGWLARVRDLAAGQRQVSELHVAGDFADLHSYTLKRLDHDVAAITNCEIAVVPHERLDKLFEHHPRLQRIYWFNTNLDAAIHREWAVSLGRRSALSRLAHLFWELNIRLGIVGLAEDGSYELPLTQEDLSECLGMTAVHINRSLQELRARDLIRVQHKRVTILQPDELANVAEFNPAYLYLDRRPSDRQI